MRIESEPQDLYISISCASPFWVTKKRVHYTYGEWRNILTERDIGKRVIEMELKRLHFNYSVVTGLKIKLIWILV